MPSELWLVRHGETEWSLAGKHTSFTDLELTANGKLSATKLRDRLAGVAFERVLTSPLARARQTCELAGFGERAAIVEALHEWRYGADEGRTTAEIRQHRPGWTVWTDGPQNGESADEVSQRADDVIALVRSSSGRTLAFCHGHMSRVIGARWIGLAVRQAAHLRLETAAISVLGWERETPVVRLWNDVGHLPHLAR
jgi:broad specificity phosphatase PhoE